MTSEKRSHDNAVMRLWRGFARRRYRPRSDTTVLALLVIGAAVITYDLVRWPDVMPISLMAVPMLIGSLVLPPRQMPWFVVACLISLACIVIFRNVESFWGPVQIAVVFGIGVLILLASVRRSELGVTGVRGESMLIDLRDRIQRQGVIPALPEQWYAEGALRSAEGTAFAGDFVVATRTGHLLEVAVVDVSGKGTAAGIRALLLTGAFGGLLGAIPPREFLPAANAYLLRQDWDEGFATAVHLALDLQTGEFQLWTAGHPPAVRRNAGTGRWAPIETSGPVLGLIEDAEFTTCTGMMRPGDAMMLYTDGIVETRHRDIGLGIDRLVGQAERMLRSGYEHGAARLIERLGSDSDDRALLLLHRR